MEGNIIAFSIPKGGNGKTSMTRNLSALFSKRGKTLVVDMDSQGNVTNYFLGRYEEGEKKGWRRKLDDENHVANLFLGKRPKPLELAENLYLVGSNIHLLKFEEQPNLDSYHTLKDYLTPLKKVYDYILVDCPPSLSLLTTNAYLAADYIIAPVDSTEDTLDSVDILNWFTEKRRKFNPRLKLLGIVLANYKENDRIDNEIRRQLKAKCGDQLFDTRIPNTTKLKRARSEYKTVFDAFPEHKISRAYRHLYNEIIERIEKMGE